MSAPQHEPDREPTRERARWTVVTPARSLVPLVLAIGAVGLVLHLLQGILLPFVIAAVTAYVCVPLIDWVMARTRLPRWPAALGVLALLMGAAALLGFLGLPVLIGQAQSLMTDLHGAVTGLMRALIGQHSVHVLGSTLDAERVAYQIVGVLQHWMSGGQLLTVVGWGVAAAFGFMLVWVLMGYFLVDAPAIASGLRWLVPPGRRVFAEQVWHELDPILRRYFIGVAVVVAYATAAAYLGLGLILGLHHALALALLTGVLEIIPVIGPLAAAVVAGLVAVQQAASARDIWAYVGYAVALRLSIDQLVGPIVLGNASRLHPVVVIFCFLAGGALFGIVGMILAVPIALLVKMTLSVLYRQAR
jgi:predicted PurR-regulated permease PerM